MRGFPKPPGADYMKDIHPNSGEPKTQKAHRKDRKEREEF